MTLSLLPAEFSWGLPGAAEIIDPNPPSPPERELNLAEVSTTVSRWKREEEEEEEEKIPLWCQKSYAQKRENSSDVKDCSA